ncbi:sulfotransferase family cytosolic 1B member 1-like [Lingula anatina]|uniref:Sulfotransferase family cytosolic 1B member 1-like n=1 Tax=Lingula anatina TaxID=7574 RepID=A0A1S3IG17_LINAN|nr:sulfotransferase family cytosolic 1B member 1-like [Lingula anatina]|eukprot:XP_013397162.1 sulfotransferase family cytosolic 1B member 1-like [Lingula anatina]
MDLPADRWSKDNLIKVPDADSNEFTLIEYAGRNWPVFPGLSQRLEEDLAQFKARPDDTWIINWPKSGTHWCWEICSMLVSGKAELLQQSKLTAMYPEAVGNAEIEPMPSPRVLNTHVTPDYFPKEALENSKLIFTVRHPKDVAVSYFYHLKGIKFYQYETGAWAGYFPVFLEGRGENGDWINHTESWLSVLDDNSNALVLKFEDLKKDLRKEVQRIAEFLEVSGTDEFYDEVARLCSFDSMKEGKTPGPDIWRQEASGFFRKGITEDWKHHFTVAQNEEFNRRYRETLKDTIHTKKIGYEFL